MTAKEKAIELVNKFIDEIPANNSESIKEFIKIDIESSKRCALIAIDELIMQNGELYLNGLNSTYYREKNNFLFNVKSEIEKL